MKKTQKGFTLVELLVVIAILAILATVSVVGYTSFIEKAELSNAQTEAHQIATLIESALMTENKDIVSTKTISTEGTSATTYIVATKTNVTITFANVTNEEDVSGIKTDLSNDLKDFTLAVSDTELHYTSSDDITVNVLTGDKIK